MRKRKPAVYPTDDGDVDVVVRELTAEEAGEFEMASARGAPNALGMLLQLSIEDPETQQLLFEVTDRGVLQTLGVLGLKDTLLLIKEMSGITDADIEKAKGFLGAGRPNGST